MCRALSVLAEYIFSHFFFNKKIPKFHTQFSGLYTIHFSLSTAIIYKTRSILFRYSQWNDCRSIFISSSTNKVKRENKVTLTNLQFLSFKFHTLLSSYPIKSMNTIQRGNVKSSVIRSDYNCENERTDYDR